MQREHESLFRGRGDQLDAEGFVLLHPRTGEVELAQSVFGARVAHAGGGLVPESRRREIHRARLAALVNHPDLEAGVRVTLLRGPLEPLERRLVVLSGALAVEVRQADVIVRARLAALRRFHEQLQGFGVVLLDSPTVAERHAVIAFRLGQAGVRRPPEPVRRHVEIALDPIALDVQATESDLRLGVVVPGGDGVPLHGALDALLRSRARLVHVGEPEFPLGELGQRGQVGVAECLGVVLLDVLAEVVHLREQAQREGIGDLRSAVEVHQGAVNVALLEEVDAGPVILAAAADVFLAARVERLSRGLGLRGVGRCRLRNNKAGNQRDVYKERQCSFEHFYRLAFVSWAPSCRMRRQHHNRAPPEIKEHGSREPYLSTSSRSARLRSKNTHTLYCSSEREARVENRTSH